ELFLVFGCQWNAQRVPFPLFLTFGIHLIVESNAHFFARVVQIVGWLVSLKLRHDFLFRFFRLISSEFFRNLFFLSLLLIRHPLQIQYWLEIDPTAYHILHKLYLNLELLYVSFLGSFESFLYQKYF